MSLWKGEVLVSESSYKVVLVGRQVHREERQERSVYWAGQRLWRVVKKARELINGSNGLACFESYFR
jgi:hypothetical protein